MTRLLWLRAAPLPYETPISNASRNAVLNHQTHGVRAFCTDLGLDLRGLQDGEDTAIAQLAQMVGVCPSAYDRGTMRRNGNKFVLRGEWQLQASVRRKRIFVCPACVSEDIASSSLPPPASACYRSHWLLDSVRSCPQHELELVELQPSDNKAIHDFSVQIAPHLDALEALPRKRASVAEFRFQTYLHDRLDKVASAGFLDQLEFHVAARFCEMLGATLKIGESQALTSLSNRDWLSIGELGFSYAHEGPDGIRAALHDIQRKSTYSRSGNDGIRAMHGRLFKWISHYQEDDAHAPIRDILREHIIATVPVRPGETLLGKVVMERQKLHSVRTASIEAGIPPRQLRKILQALGHLGPEHANRPNSWTVFDAEQHADLLNDIRHSMPLSVASEYLGAGPAHGRLLFEWGFIQPFVRQSAEHPIKEHQFTKRELDD